MSNFFINIMPQVLWIELKVWKCIFIKCMGLNAVLFPISTVNNEV